MKGVIVFKLKYVFIFSGVFLFLVAMFWGAKVPLYCSIPWSVSIIIEILRFNANEESLNPHRQCQSNALTHVPEMQQALSDLSDRVHGAEIGLSEFRSSDSLSDLSFAEHCISDARSLSSQAKFLFSRLKPALDKSPPEDLPRYYSYLFLLLRNVFIFVSIFMGGIYFALSDLVS